MLLVNQLIGFGVVPAVGGAATVNFEESQGRSTNESTATFTGMDLGASASNRKVVVVIGASNSVTSFSSVTVDGNSASFVARGQAASQECIEIWQIEEATLGSSTNANVVAAFGSTSAAHGCATFSVYGAAASANDTFGGVAAPVSDTAFNVPAGGIAIGGVEQRTNTAAAFSWTGITTDNGDFTLQANDSYMSVAHDAYASVQTNITVEASSDQAGVRDPAGVWASWGPA